MSDQRADDLGGETQAQQPPMQTESPFSTNPPLMGGIDPMTLNSLPIDSIKSDSGQRQSTSVSARDNPLESLAPKFPPQNFEVPDISFSNSVSPNEHFDQSIFSSVRDMADTGPLFSHVTATSGCMAIPQPVISNQTAVDGMAMTFCHPNNMPDPAVMTTQNQLTTPQLPVSRSPTGTSSSDDSDDLPLAQIALKRTTGIAVSCSPSGMPATMVTKASQSSIGPGITDVSSSFPDPTASPTESNPPTGSPPAGKKGKPSKRKKKKDPNEPQKPVSAYALFFRDTQATIKGHNPSASFGEVSKIVASMWDQLDPQHKDVYKKKTEVAKKLYLKQLAAYRASQVSKSAADESDKSPSPPGIGVAQPAMGGSSPGTVQNLGMIPSGPGNAIMPASINGPMMYMPPQIMQQQQQQFIHQQQQQLQMHHHQMPAQTLSPSPPSSLQELSPSQQHMHHQTSTHQPQNMDMAFNRCTRRGCSNQVMENPAWDSEYCSNECVIIHCRDVFSTWSAAHSGSNKFPVK